MHFVDLVSWIGYWQRTEWTI